MSTHGPRKCPYLRGANYITLGKYDNEYQPCDPYSTLIYKKLNIREHTCKVPFTISYKLHQLRTCGRKQGVPRTVYNCTANLHKNVGLVAWELQPSQVIPEHGMGCVFKWVSALNHTNLHVNNSVGKKKTLCSSQCKKFFRCSFLQRACWAGYVDYSEPWLKAAW
jgi:hypothetical protein